MNIFETLGPKLRKAILLVEAGSRLLRRMKSGVVVNEFPSGSGPHNVGAQSQQLAKSIDVFGPENWNRGTLAHEISHIVKPYDPLRKRTGRLRVMLDKLKEQRNSFLTRKKELPRIKERADKAEELLRRVQARSEAKANFYGKQKHLRGREYDWHKDTNGELPPNLAKRQQEYLNAADAPDYHTRSKAYLKLSAVARAGNLQEGLWDSIKSGARYIARGAANTLGKIRSAGVVDEQTFNRDARNVGRAQRAAGSKLNIGLTHDDKFPAPLALAQPGKPGDAASVALVGLPPKGKRSARALVHEINHLERGAKGPLSDEGLKTKFVPKIMKTRRNSLMKQEDLHVKLQKGEIMDEQFRKKAHKARRAERRLKREIGNDLDKFDHINARRSLRDEAKASAGLLRRGPKGVKGMEMQSAFRTYVSGAAPSKFKGGSRQPDIDRKVRDWQGNKTPLPRSPEQMRAKPVLSENPKVKRKRDELAHRLRNFRKAGGLYPEGLENKSWLKLSAVARAGNLQEALSEKVRADIPKNKFAAPTMPRAGHADKGLYPIFDKKSAKSALKLSGKHPHLKQEIARRAAAYGVKPEKKGTRYA